MEICFLNYLDILLVSLKLSRIYSRRLHANLISLLDVEICGLRYGSRLSPIATPYRDMRSFVISNFSKHFL